MDGEDYLHSVPFKELWCMTMEVQQAVRNYLRAADIVLDLLKENGHLSDEELRMLEAYNSRIHTFLVKRGKIHAHQ